MDGSLTGAPGGGSSVLGPNPAAAFASPVCSALTASNGFACSSAAAGAPQLRRASYRLVNSADQSRIAMM